MMMMKKAGSLTAMLALAGMADALDMKFSKISCDTSLPAFAYDDDIKVQCEYEEATGEKRSDPSTCSLGDSAVVSGLLYYQDMASEGLLNNTGYASADLSLMTLDVQLFTLLPFNFCGDWVQRSQYNYNDCPGDGKYHFELPYTFPTTFDATTWFATGWKGEAFLEIYADQYEDADLLAQCKMTFETSVTQSEEEGWKTLPTAAQVSIGLVGTIAALALCICCMTFCRSKRKHAAVRAYEDDPITQYRTMDEKREREQEKRRTEHEESDDDTQDNEQKAFKFSRRMKYGRR